MGEKLFHSDETRWNVLAPLAGKANHRWCLWVTRSALVVLYQIDPSRGAAVPKAHFAALQLGSDDVVLVCDRYSAYKCLAKEHDKMLLAYCWAHVRRDFLTASRSWPEVAPWMGKWLEDIRTLYQLTTARRAVWDATASLERQSPAFVVCHQALTAHVQQMQERWVMYRRERDLHPAKRPLLDSLHHHWGGLTVFLTRPEVPLDNNSAERALRYPVVSRKTYYGSGSLWSAPRGYAVEHPPNGAALGAQPAALAQRLLAGLYGPGWHNAPGPLCLLALADDGRAHTPAGTVCPGAHAAS